MTTRDTTTDEPHGGDGIAITITDSRGPSGEQPGAKSENTDGVGEPDQTDEDSGFTVTRRDVLVTSVAGYLFGGTGTVAAQDGSDQTIEIELNDGVGSNYHRVPNHFRIGNNTSFSIDPDSGLSGQHISVFIEVKPASLSKEKYEVIAEEAFIAGESAFNFNTADLADEERDLTSHSEIALEDFRIDASIGELGTKENRYVVNSYDIRLRLVDEQGGEIKKQSKTFDVTYGLRGGAGVRFGYNTGKVAPTDDFRSGSEVK